MFDIKDIEDAIYSIQVDIIDSNESFDEGDIGISLSTNGFATVVDFCGITLWCSENDDREYTEMTDLFEPFEPFLRRKLKELLDKFKLIEI